MPRKPSAVRHFLVTVSGVTALFAVKTGGHPSSSGNKVWDGGNPNPEILTEPVDYDDLTVRRPYRADRDAPIAARLRPRCGRSTHTITVQPTDEDYVRIGKPTRYHGVLMSVREPDTDAGSSDAGQLELTFSINRAI